jgi:hypothetical protein
MAGATEAAFEVQSGATLEAFTRHDMEPPSVPDVVTAPTADAAAADFDALKRFSSKSGNGAPHDSGARAALRAGDKDLSSALKPNTFLDNGVIANDRDLLIALDLSDADASTYVQRSRQTLNNQLGAQKENHAPDNYFKPGDLLMLVFAAARECPTFDTERREKVLAYIRRSRGGTGMSKDERVAYDLVIDTLATGGDVKLDGARGVIFLLPDFAGMSAVDPQVVARLRGLAGEIASQENRPWVLILSSNVYQAQAASDALGFEDQAAHTISHDHVEHYMPSVMIYRSDSDTAPYAITGAGDFIFAPQYRAPMMLACLKQMLPSQLRDALFKPAEGNRKQAAS